MAGLFLTDALLMTPDGPCAGSVEIRDGRIARLFGARGGMGRRPGDAVFGLRGGRLAPSFADAHVHLESWAIGEMAVDLSDSKDLEDASRQLLGALRGRPASEWLVARSWNRNGWPDPRWPAREDLDRVAGDRPALVSSLDLHACWAGSAALAAAGIAGDLSGRERELPRGVMLRRREGRLEATGVLREDAAWWMTGLVPRPAESQVRAAIRGVVGRLVRFGVTAVTDFDGLPAARLCGELDLPLRIRASLRREDLAAMTRQKLRAGVSLGGRVTLGVLKLFADGSLGSKSAWMLEPYEGSADDAGIGLLTARAMERIAAPALARGFDLAVHAIGDRANREVLDAFARIRPRYPRARLRLEHAQLLAEGEQQRLAALEVTASVQPSHIRDDVPTADRVWGSRSRRAYPLASLSSAGAAIAFGSDVPVGDPDPRAGLGAARFRLSRRGGPPGGWYPAERLGAAAAFAAYTAGAHALCSPEHPIGRLSAGCEADLMQLDGDPIGGDPGRVDVVATWLGGSRIDAVSGGKK